MATNLIIFLSCFCITYASHGSYNIPIEGYETELQVLGQHVEIPETPVKVVKITKTIAVKIPVPYPVKVIEKVPYPVHIAKPYPVPVPQIVKVPAPRVVPHKHAHGDGNAYQVQENNHGSGHSNDVQSYGPIQQSYEGGDGQGPDYETANDGFNQEPRPHNYHATNSFDGGHYDDSDGNGASESKSYDDAIQAYIASVASKAHGGSLGYH